MYMNIHFSLTPFRCFFSVLSCFILIRPSVSSNILPLSSLHEILFDDQIKKNEMGGTCSTSGGRGTNISLVGKPEGKRQLARLGVNWVMLELILEKQDGRAWNSASGSRQGQVAGCEHSNKYSGSMKCR